MMSNYQMMRRIRALTNVALSYLDDGAAHTAADRLSEAATEVKAWAEQKDRALEAYTARKPEDLS